MGSVRGSRWQRKLRRIRSVPWKMTLPFTISPMMHPTDHISTETRKQSHETNTTHCRLQQPPRAAEMDDTLRGSDQGDVRYMQSQLLAAPRPAALIICILRLACFPLWLWSQPLPSRSFSSPLQLSLSVYTAVAFFITSPAHVLSGKGCRLTLGFTAEACSREP